jgi:hypothetical protein
MGLIRLPLGFALTNDGDATWNGRVACTCLCLPAGPAQATNPIARISKIKKAPIRL